MTADVLESRQLARNARRIAAALLRSVTLEHAATGWRAHYHGRLGSWSTALCPTANRALRELGEAMDVLDSELEL